MRGFQRLIGFILVAFVAVTSHAQSSDRMQDRDPDLDASKRLAAELQQANFHYGAFYLLSKLRLSDVGYSGDVATLPTGEQSSGLSLSVEAPQRIYYVPTKKTIFTLELTPGYSFFSSGDQDGQFNYMVRGDGHFLLNHLYLDVYGLREDQLRAHVADINRLTTVRNDEAGVAGEFKYSSKTSALFTMRIRDTTFPTGRLQPEQIPVNLLDRSERNGRLSFLHKTFPLTSLFVAAEGSDYGFARATYKDSTRTYLGAGAIYTAGRTLLRGELGTAKLDFDDAAERDFSGIIGSLRAQRYSGRRTYDAGFHRDLGFSVFAANNYFISNILRAGMSHSATRRLTLRAGSTYQRDDYDVPVGGVDRRDTASFTYVGLMYAVRRVNIGSDVGWYERTSNIGGDTDSGIRYVVHLSFTP